MVNKPLRDHPSSNRESVYGSKTFPILTFHAIDDRPSVISFSPALFERSICLLHNLGYRTLSVFELCDCLDKGVPIPERSLMITFDDGYQSVYDHAFPALQRYGFTATVFLALGESGKMADSHRLPSMCERSMVSWGEIREMFKGGITFGGHTLTHPDLTRVPFDQLESEVYLSKQIIEDALGSEVVSFAYPFGRYDERCRDIVSRRFLYAFSDKLGLVGERSDRFALERVDSYYLRSEKLIGMMPTKLFPLYVCARAVPRRLRRGLNRTFGDRWG